MRATFLVLAAALLWPALSNAAPPRAYTAEYEVLRNDEALGRATVTFRALGNGRWELRSLTRGTGGLAAIAGVEIEETSVLRWVGGRPETISYRFRQDAAWSKRQRSIDVDARAGRVVSINKDRRLEFPYQAGVLDRHAVTVAMMQDVAAGGVRELSYAVADRNSLDQQRYSVAANVRLRTALGTLRAIRMERLRVDAEGRETKVWLARERGFVPVRIKQYEGNGDTIDMRILSVR